MPSKLIIFGKDPMEGMNRGAGKYYHRGKGVWSKYSAKRDALIKATGFDIDKIGLPAKSKHRHLMDGKIGW